MFKKLGLIVLAVLMVSACSQGSSSQPVSSSPEVVNKTVSPSEFMKDGKFVFTPVEDKWLIMEYSPATGAVNKDTIFGMDFPVSLDTDFLNETEYDANFKIFDSETKEAYGSVTVKTAPANIKELLGATTDEELSDKMKANFFTADTMYNGLRSDILEGFEYELPVDLKGTAYEWDAFYFEFIAEDLGKHSLRFYICNGELNENFYSMMIKIDVPIGEEELLNDLRSVVTSLSQRGI